MLEVFIKAIITFSLVIWFVKSLIDVLEYRKVAKLSDHGLGLASGTDHGMEIDSTTGNEKTTARPIGY